MTVKVTNTKGCVTVELGGDTPKLVVRNAETEFEIFNISLDRDLIERIHRLLNAAEAFMGDEK